MTTIAFPAFPSSVSEGDKVSVIHDGFTLTATVYFDDGAGEPGDNDEGFWPSNDPAAAGYVEPENYEAEYAKATAVFEAWKRDEWFYCGVAVTVSKAGVELVGPFDVALWGVEANYPGDNVNGYLSEVAFDIADEALSIAKAKISALCAA